MISDCFNTLREPLIEPQKKTDKKQDEQLKDNQDRIVQAIEYNPAISYDGKTFAELEWDGEEPSHEYAFVDTDDESSEEEPSTSNTDKKVGILNLNKGINDEYKTLLKDKGYDLPSEIFNEQKNVDDIAKKVESKLNILKIIFKNIQPNKGDH